MRSLKAIKHTGSGNKYQIQKKIYAKRNTGIISPNQFKDKQEREYNEQESEYCNRN